MSETMTSPNDWSQFFNQQKPSSSSNNNQMLASSGSRTLSGSILFGDQSISNATVVATTATTITSPTTTIQTANHLSPEGRVSKPVRRRSRASRRTPTTLLNTDTTNFRAMVQQFTGGPSAPFASSGIQQLNGPMGLGFGVNSRQPYVNTSGAVMVPAAGYQLQYQQQQQQQQQQRYQQQSQQAYMLSLSNNNSETNPPGAADNHVFSQRLGNSRPAGMEVQGGFVMEGNSSSQLPPFRPPGTSSNDNRSNSSFLF